MWSVAGEVDDMGMRIARKNSIVSKKSFGAFFAILALFVQPIVQLNIPEAIAASENITSAVFEANDASVDTDANSSIFRVRLKNAANNDEAVSSTANLKVTSTSVTGRFAPTTAYSYGSSNENNFTISFGTSLRSFYYKDSTPGTHTIVAEASGGGMTSSKIVEIQVDVVARTDTSAPSEPVPSVDGGDYTLAQTVALSSSDESGSVTIRYTTDGTIPSATSGTIYNSPITILTTTTLKAVAYDAANNSSSVMSAMYTITPAVVDSTLDAPVNLTPLSGTITKDPNFAMTWSSVAGAVSYEYQTSNILTQDGSIGPIVYSDNSQAQAHRYAESNGTVTRQNIATPAGTYYWQVRAIGQGGQPGLWSVIAKVTTDYSVPGLYLKDTSQGNVAQRTLREADFKLTDNQKVVAYRINGVRVAVSPNAFSDANDIKVGAKNGIYGKNTTQTEDAAGNLSDEFTFYLDNVLPTATVKSGSVGSGTTFNTVSYKLHDAYKIDKITLNGVEKNLTDSTYSDLNNVKPGVFGAIEGSNVLVIYDVAGNPSTYNFTLDTIKPSGTFSYDPSNDVIKKGPVTVTLTTTEAVNTPDGWARVSDTSFTKEFTENIKGSVYVTDYTGNTSDELKYEVKRIDNTRPVIGDVQDGEFRNSALTNFTVTDQNFQRAFIDGTATNCLYSGANYLWNCSGPSAHGSYTLTAVDKAGNDAQEVSFTIDTEPPVAEASTSNEGQPTQGPVDVTIVANEPITISAWQNDPTVTVSDDGKVWTKEYTENTQGQVSVNVTDRAGNPTTVSFTVSGIDNDKPEVEINQITRTSDGRYIINGTVTESGVNVTLAIDEGEARPATVTGQTWSFTTGVLPDGTYRITVSAADAAGNTTTARQSFTATAPFVGGETVDASQTTAPLSFTTFASVPTSNQLATGTNDSGSVLGATATPSADDGEVLGTRDQKRSDVVAAVAPSDEGWKLWGVAWYWWLIPILVALGTWRYLVYRQRHSDTLA